MKNINIFGFLLISVYTKMNYGYFQPGLHVPFVSSGHNTGPQAIFFSLGNEYVFIIRLKALRNYFTNLTKTFHWLTINFHWII